ncbi:hypothetical protein BD410DRAFT_613185 [Rickenella mellea]|uniref:Uncharacterized protein n=1 Tax=Rickenella mellea TaxID=50990 RepID=A0A4Y7PPF9_9AGAM|nr:hypothetical protein BD410DRAFT_613185 [Rickenella mellea]
MSDEVTLLVKTELQYDYDVTTPVIGGGTGTGIAATLDAKSLLTSYYISGTQVLATYQTLDSNGDASPGWTKEDTNFPTTETPLTLRTASVNNSNVDVVAVGSKNNDVWILTTGGRFPMWVKYQNKVGGQLVDVQPAYDAAGNLRIAVVLFTVGSAHLLYLVDPTTGTWTPDQGVHVSTLGVHDFVVSADFASTVDNSNFGYLIAGDGVTNDNTGAAVPGIITVTGGKRISAKRVVATGNFTSVSSVALPYPNALPLIFAVEAQTQLGVYFQAQANGTFTRVNLFGTTKIQKIQSVLRKSNDGVSAASTWVEVFALDATGNILHIESDMTQDPVLVATGLYTISKWRDVAFIAKGMAGLFLASTADGLAILLAVGQDRTLQQWVQDPASTDWSSQTLAVPDSSGKSAVGKKTVYYVEVSAFDVNNVPKSGLTATIYGVQYANINVNGRPAMIDPIRSVTANTNPMGKISLTYDAPDSLAAPTVSIWVEGMPLDIRTDVQGSGDIQKKLKNITSDDLANATNQETGKPLLVNVDPTLRGELVTALTGVMAVIDPEDQTPTNAAVSNIADVHGASKALSRRFIHPKTKSHVAATRSRFSRSLGHIRGPGGKAVHIKFRHAGTHHANLKSLIVAKHMTSAEAQKAKADIRAFGFPSLDFSFGDVFNAIKDGIYTVVDVVVDGIKDAASALITLVKDAATFIWEGTCNFVRQAFEVVGAIFEKVKVFFQDLFAWLAFLLDWDDIKHSAETFKSLLTGFQQEGSTWVSTTLPQATDSFFQSCKSGLTAQFDTAKAYMNGVSLNSYDSSAKPPGNALAATGASGSDQPQLDDLPSTAMWLLNKILNAGGGDNGYSFLSNSLTALESFFASFEEAANTAGLSDDFNAAVTDFTHLFSSFSDRSAADGTAWDNILDATKHMVFVVLDLLETLVLVFEKACAEAFKFFAELLNAPIDLPIISPIFKFITGTDLTCINAVCYAFAIPFTLLYKLITGNKPFQNSNPLLHNSAAIRALAVQDELTVARGVLTLINAPLDAFQDLVGIAFDLINPISPGGNIRFLNIAGLLIPFINSALSYKSLDKGPIYITSWSIAVAAPSISLIWLCATGLRKGPRGHIVGQVILGLLGGGALGTAIWHAVDPEDSSGKTKAVITSQFFASLSNLAKPLRAVSQRAANPVTIIAVGVALPVIDLVSGIGAGSALIAAGTS